MSDYISRTELDRIIHLLHTECAYDMPSFDSKNGYKVIPTRYHKGYQQSLIDLESRIAELPSADVRENRWISVSERLPEEFQRVLVTIVNYKGNKVVRVAEYHNRKEKDVFQIKENHEEWEVGEKGLLAWMPLPEPYKAESEE